MEDIECLKKVCIYLYLLFYVFLEKIDGYVGGTVNGIEIPLSVGGGG